MLCSSYIFYWSLTKCKISEFHITYLYSYFVSLYSFPDDSFSEFISLSPCIFSLTWMYMKELMHAWYYTMLHTTIIIYHNLIKHSLSTFLLICYFVFFFVSKLVCLCVCCLCVPYFACVCIIFSVCISLDEIDGCFCLYSVCMFVYVLCCLCIC